MAPNQPCIIEGLTASWPASSDRVSASAPDMQFLKAQYPHKLVPVHVITKQPHASCFGSVARPSKTSMTVADYVDWFEGHRLTREFAEEGAEAGGDTEDGREGGDAVQAVELHYLKGWNFSPTLLPSSEVYSCPDYFKELDGAYRFVYVGPKHTATTYTKATYIHDFHVLSEASEEIYFDDWYRRNSSSARAYWYLEDLEFGLVSKGQTDLRCISFIDGDHPGSSYLGATVPDLVSLSLLQERLNQLNTGLRIKVLEND